MRSCVADYELLVPRDLRSVLDLLANGEGWRPFAGGTDLMVLLNAGKLPFQRLVSIRKIEELRSIAVAADVITIGAGVTYAQIEKHPVLQAEFPLLCQAASWTGGVANRNQGTLAGNIANASPAADSAPPLLVYDAQVQLIKAAGARSVPYSEFHTDYKVCAIRPEELIRAIDLPRRDGAWRYRGRKVGTRQAQAISKVSFAAGVQLDKEKISEVRLAFGSVAPIPLRCFATERFLAGRTVTDVVIENARQMLKSEMAPISDIRSTATYRSLAAQNLLSEFLETLR